MSDRYEPYPPAPTLHTLDERLQRVEQLLIRLDGQMSPRWLRITSYGAFIGSAVGAGLKLWIGSK